nr:hypothetical protein [Tanacetum cinerariifolium]
MRKRERVVVDDPGTSLEMDVNKLTSIPSTSNVASKKVMDECESDIEDIYDETTQYIVSGGANDTSFLEDEDYDTHDFEPSMFELGESLPSVDDLVTEQDVMLADDTIVEHKTNSTRHGERKLRIKRKGQRPSASKWFSKEVREA